MSKLLLVLLFSIIFKFYFKVLYFKTKLFIISPHLREKDAKKVQSFFRLFTTANFGNFLLDIAIFFIVTRIILNISKIVIFDALLISVYIKYVIVGLFLLFVYLILFLFYQLIYFVFYKIDSLELNSTEIGFLNFVFGIFFPIFKLINYFLYIMKKIFKIDLELDDVYNLENVIKRKEVFEEEEEMINSIYEMNETYVKEIMVPRIDVVGIDINSSLDEIVNIVKENGHSRMPVYDDSIDNIIGILYVKDLFIAISKSKNFDIKSILREPFFVPEVKKIYDLLKEFQAKKVHIAIVVDEYGGTAGLITLEDILEEIVGEIQDEYDEDEFSYKQLDNNVFLIKGSMNIDDVNEILNIDLPAKDYDTIGGFIYDLLGSIPKSKQKIVYENIIFIIEELKGQRINLVKVIINNNKNNEKA